MSKLNTVRALIQKAGRLDTPIDEARTAALAAARMMVKEGFDITDDKRKEKENDETETYVDYDVPDFSHRDFEEVTPFVNDVAKDSTFKCVSCGNEIRKGTVYTREAQKRNYRVTHYECRRFFTGM